MTWPVAASTAAVTNRRRRRRRAEAMTVSSNPSCATGPNRAGSPANSSADSRTADHSVCQPTPSRRAEDATDPSTASSLPTAHPTAREVNTRRGPASAVCSVQHPASHPAPGHAQIRFFHRTLTGRPPAAGASRKHTSRRPLDRALRPQRSQNTLWPSGVCTHTTTSPRSSRTPVTSKPSAPNHTTELTSTTRGLPTLGPLLESQESARPPPQWRTLKSPRSQLRREDPIKGGADPSFSEARSTEWRCWRRPVCCISWDRSSLLRPQPSFGAGLLSRTRLSSPISESRSFRRAFAASLLNTREAAMPISPLPYGAGLIFL